MTDPAGDEQRRVVLTAHPLQRIGGLSLHTLGGAVGILTPEQFDAAVERMTADAVRAAFVENTKADGGFWLKTSGSFFPNSPMNHALRFKDRDGLRERVTQWRRMPAPEMWPVAACALCGRQAVGFYGKVDVPLAASIAYRNTVPRGHGGMALCWPCVCSFYALPYGCVLTGGPSSVLHSFSDTFLHDEVSRQVAVNHQHITLGVPVVKPDIGREAVALRRLREHVRDPDADVDLMIFSNDNREPSLAVHTLSQPLAAWLRRTQRPSNRRGYAALVRAHLSARSTGLDNLARNAFYSPDRVVAAVARYGARAAERTGSAPDTITDLAQICHDFMERVLHVNDDDIKQVEALADNLAISISAGTAKGPLTGLLAASRRGAELRSLLQTTSAKWLLNPPDGAGGALMTTRQFRLLFDPDGQAWLYRQLLVIAVLEKLSDRGWRPADAAAAVEEVEELDDAMRANAAIDDRHLDEDGETR